MIPGWASAAQGAPPNRYPLPVAEVGVYKDGPREIVRRFRGDLLFTFRAVGDVEVTGVAGFDKQFEARMDATLEQREVYAVLLVDRTETPPPFAPCAERPNSTLRSCECDAA